MNSSTSPRVSVQRPDCMAEREGFEPSVRVSVQRFSRPSRSTTPAPLRINIRQTPGDTCVSRYNGFHSVHPCTSPCGPRDAWCKSAILPICRDRPVRPLFRTSCPPPFGPLSLTLQRSILLPAILSGTSPYVAQRNVLNSTLNRRSK